MKTGPGEQAGSTGGDKLRTQKKDAEFVVAVSWSESFRESIQFPGIVMRAKN